ncbi:Tn3 family transposase [Nonomuraea sp. B10E15]|uniref:Tn3 family transposase n=1 Tax=Nonomuraea sp. B10E15 TaxID=3153560 RepID=UPI00325C632B
MTSVERTAYRLFPRLMMTRELYLFYSPSQEELAWAREKTDTDEPLLALTLALKCFQRWPDLMRVAISIREGRLNSVTLLRRLGSHSRKNEIYRAFREVGRSVRTVALLRFLADPALRRRITAFTNKVEGFNGFSAWLRFGNDGVIADNDPAEQEKMIKCNSLLANCVIFHTALDMMEVSVSFCRRAGRSAPRTSHNCRPT